MSPVKKQHFNFFAFSCQALEWSEAVLSFFFAFTVIVHKGAFSCDTVLQQQLQPRHVRFFSSLGNTWYKVDICQTGGNQRKEE